MNIKKLFSALSAFFLLLGQVAPVLAIDWYIDNGDISIHATDSGQTVSQGSAVDVPDDNPVITQLDSNAPTDNTVTINADAGATANVTLENVNITAAEAAVSTGGDGNVNIELNGNNTLQSGDNHAGLEKNNGGALVISDENNNGSLTAQGGLEGAGIGGGKNDSGSNITVSGGTISATGGEFGAGIGGGADGFGSDITVNGGTVTATGGLEGAGIGGGVNSAGSSINISGGEVTAKGGLSAAGIGGGQYGTGGDITVSGGTVTAQGGEHGAGIGGGRDGHGNGITISGGEVSVSGGTGAAGIGGGIEGEGNNIIVSGDAQVKTQGGKAIDNVVGAGADLGDGGSFSSATNSVKDGERDVDTSGLTTSGWIKSYAPGADMNSANPAETIIGDVTPNPTTAPTQQPTSAPTQPSNPEPKSGTADNSSTQSGTTVSTGNPVVRTYAIGSSVTINNAIWIVVANDGIVLTLASADAFSEDALKDLDALIKTLLTMDQRNNLVSDGGIALADEVTAKTYFGGEAGHILIRVNRLILE